MPKKQRRFVPLQMMTFHLRDLNVLQEVLTQHVRANLKVTGVARIAATVIMVDAVMMTMIVRLVQRFHANSNVRKFRVFFREENYDDKKSAAEEVALFILIM